MGGGVEQGQGGFARKLAAKDGLSVPTTPEGAPSAGSGRKPGLTVNIARWTHGGAEPDPVPAKCIQGVWALHKATKPDGRPTQHDWCVTHIPTGCCVGSFRKCGEARVLFDRLVARLSDWESGQVLGGEVSAESKNALFSVTAELVQPLVRVG